jgi:membrane protein implicated in regulation of membrane protease activity
MKNTLIVILFALLFSLVTFFGLGPILIAQGTLQERWMTSLVVLLLYVVLTYSLRRFLIGTNKKG